jgi:predicted ATPase/DNA-binding SARP family transcriptional activator
LNGSCFTEETPVLDVCLFGTFRLHLRGRPAPPFRSRAGQWLLALLILRHDRETDRAWLAETLWPESGRDQALYNLRRNLTDLRRVLGPEAARLLSPQTRTLRFDCAGAACDLHAFDAALQRGEDADLLKAVSCYGGPLLDGCDESWVLPERASRADAYLNALERLAARAEPGQAVHYYQRMIVHDPLRESAHRRLWTALAACGDYAALTRSYRDLQVRLYEEMGGTLSPETSGVYRELLSSRGNLSCPPPSTASSERHPPGSPEPLPEPPRPFPGFLPVFLTSLVGRDAAIEEVAEDVRALRLVTLTGTGGVGKTRLAVAVAERIGEEFREGGVWFVDLTSVSRPERVAQAMAEVLEVREEPGRPWLETLGHALGRRTVLLVLDNCEHVNKECARICRTLLGECPGLKLLVTSRQPLGIDGERLWRVPSLIVPPEPPSNPPPLHGLMEQGAVRLLVERAVWGNPKFQLTPLNAEAVASICRRVDGIPLALELAAARLRGMTARELAARLSEGFHLLARRDPTRVSRQLTLRATMDWSYALLSPREQTLLRRLSVFSGGWEVGAAEKVCSGGAIPEAAVLDLLSSLIDHSLVVHDTSTGRYRLLETIRAYAAEHLEESGEGGELRHRHLCWCLDYAAEWNSRRGREGALAWLHALEPERGNFHAALDGAVRSSGDPHASRPEEAVSRGLRLAVALFPFWSVRDLIPEGRDAFSSLLDRYGEGGDRALAAEGWSAAGQLAQLQSDYKPALSALAKARDLYRSTGKTTETEIVQGLIGANLCQQGNYPDGRALLEKALPYVEHTCHAEGVLLLDSLAYALREQGEYPSSRLHLERAITLSQRLGDPAAEARCRFNLGFIAFEEKSFEEAAALFEQSMSLYQQIGNRTGEARCLCSQGGIDRSSGRYGEAERKIRRALEINRKIGHRSGEVWNLNALAVVLVERKNYVEARPLFEEALEMSRAFGCLNDQAWSLIGLANVTRLLGNRRQSTRLHREALRMTRELGMKLGTAITMESFADLLIAEER